MKKRYFIIPIMVMMMLLMKMPVKSAPKEEKLTVNAQCAVLIEANTGRVLYEKDSHVQRPIASISKIMTALIAIENANLDDVVTISKEASLQVGSSLYLRQGDKIKLKDLIYGLLLRSGNDAAYAIAEYVGGDVDTFVLLMNEKAKELGLNHTTFENPSGLDETNRNISTAYDMAIITKAAMANHLYREINNTSLHRVTTPDGKVYVWANKHKLIKGYDFIIGGKTGYTKLAKRTLVSVASKDDMTLIAVTLNDSSDWDDHLKMFDYGFHDFNMKLIIQKGIFEVKQLDKIFYVDDNILYPIKDKEIYDYKIVIDVSNKKYYMLLVKNNEIMLRKELHLYDATHQELEDSYTVSNFWDGMIDFVRDVLW